jgi:hypothetical protein
MQKLDHFQKLDELKFSGKDFFQLNCKATHRSLSCFSKPTWRDIQNLCIKKTTQNKSIFAKYTLLQRSNAKGQIIQTTQNAWLYIVYHSN